MSTRITPVVMEQAVTAAYCDIPWEPAYNTINEAKKPILQLNRFHPNPEKTFRFPTHPEDSAIKKQIAFRIANRDLDGKKLIVILSQSDVAAGGTGVVESHVSPLRSNHTFPRAYGIDYVQGSHPFHAATTAAYASGDIDGPYTFSYVRGINPVEGSYFSHAATTGAHASGSGYNAFPEAWCFLADDQVAGLVDTQYGEPRIS